MKRRYWILKNEVTDYSIDEMKKDGQTDWTGVRNYQARNFMMKDMKAGDWAYFYHSNAEPPGCAGIIEISREAKPDLTALDPKSKYFEKRATKENPVWHCVQVKFKRKLKRLVPLSELRENPKLKDLLLLQRGSRLSITPVSQEAFEEIERMSKEIR